MLVVLAAIGIPAAVLTATCAGRSCDASGGEAVRVPFCPLPDAVKEGVVNGFREGRSPDVLAVADGTPVVTDVDGARTPWPAVAAATDPRVPIVFAGAGVSTGASVPDGTTLDRVAPTVSEALGFERAFPEVRSGTAVPGVADGRRPRLVLLVGWKGVGSSELETHMNDWPFLSSLLDDGSGTLDGATSVRCRSTRRPRSRRSGPAVCRRSTGSPARSSGTVRGGSCRPTRPMLRCRSSRRSPTISTTRTHRPSSASSRPTSAIAGSSAVTGTRARIPSTR